MHIRDYVAGFVVIVLLISTIVPVFLGSSGESSDSPSLAPFEEFYEPDDETERPIYEDIYRLTFNYTYMMDYDIVPENLVMFLNGTCTSYQNYGLTVNRPDGENIRLIDQERNQTDRIDETISIRHNMAIRENIYEKMRSILRKQGEDWTDPGLGDMADPTKVLFGEIDEDVLVDPDPLKGEYEIKVSVDGEDIEMNFGENETKLSILSRSSASEPRNLEGEYEDGKVKLEWDEPEDEGESGIMQYDVYRATSLYGYEYIGNVSADRTDYIDEFDGEASHQEIKEGDILYYRIVAINNDNFHYLVDSPRKRNLHPRFESMSLEEIVHLPYEETEMGDMSYKWVMNYSSLSEDNFEDRVNMDSVNINKMEGGDVFLYDLTLSEEDDGERVYEYEGGFYSKGEVDMVLEDGDTTSHLKIEMNESWFDFSGEIWAEEISNSGYEGLTIVKQTIQSEGRVSAVLDNSFRFNFKENETHWEVSKHLDIEWKIDLTLDYTEKNSWILLRENATPITPIPPYTQFNYTGSIDAKGTLNQESDHLDDEKTTEGEISKDISGTCNLLNGSLTHGRAEVFSPLVGAGNIGYYLTLDEALDQSMGSLSDKIVYANPGPLAFSTNCQRDDLSTEKLYRYQYMDPMKLPGIGSFLGTELKRANLTNSQRYLEGLVESVIRQKPQPEEDWDAWRENVTDEILGKILMENPWGIHQSNGIYRWDYFMYGGLVIEPLGYFISEPLSEDELESYNEDREIFFENQMAGEEDEDEGTNMMIIGVIVIIAITLAIIGYMMMKGGKETEKGTEEVEEEEMTMEEEYGEEEPEEDLFEEELEESEEETENEL
ncbi:MAG: hypothetical protein ACOC8Y_00605 [Candidatus Natronoplasma sp.]